jgi:two-component sensor histidine kinase
MTLAPATVATNVLVVDDVAANRLALREILGGLGCRIVEAASGPDALRKLLDDEFAVLLIDVVMPEMNGFRLAEIIRSRERTANVPILFVTAEAIDADLMYRGYRAGAVDYLVKPLEPVVVRAKVDVFIELYRQRKVIEASLREKEVLLREIHHRVKNNLQIISSLLSLQGQLQTDEVRSLFLDSGARVRSIALVHENLYQADNLAETDVDAYLHALVTGLRQTYGSPNVSVEIEDHGVQLGMDTAILCGLIINELVANALKHAFPNERPGTILISIAELDGERLVLEVCDDGIGIPSDVNVERAATMGLQIVNSLCKQLTGVLSIRRDGGTVVRVEFPHAH